MAQITRICALPYKQSTIGSRIAQDTSFASNNYLLAFLGEDFIKGLFSSKKLDDVSIWLMPSYTHERVSDMDAGSFSNAYTSHLFGFTLGTDKTFDRTYDKHYTLGLALDAALGFSNTREDIEYIKNNFHYYGASIYGALHNKNYILSANIGYERNNSKVRQLLENYEIAENLGADVANNAFYASAKGEYQIEMDYFYHSKKEKIRKAALTEGIEDIEDFEGIDDVEMPSFTQRLYGEIHRKNAHYTIEEDFDRIMSFLLVPYIGIDVMTIHSGDYTVFSYDTTGSTGTTFNVETNRAKYFYYSLRRTSKARSRRS